MYYVLAHSILGMSNVCNNVWCWFYSCSEEEHNQSLIKNKTKDYLTIHE